MIVRGAHVQTMKQVAAEIGIGVRVTRKNEGWRVDLFSSGDRFRVTGHGYACVHAHEQYIWMLLRRVPGATIETFLTTYLGLDDFRRRQAAIQQLIRQQYAEVECSCRKAHAA